MTRPAKQCDECQHFAGTSDLVAICRKQHTPRFYVPKSVYDKSWGWKRRCDDFKKENQ